MVSDFWSCYKIVEPGWNWEAIGAVGTWFIGIVAALLAAYPLWLYHFSRKVKVLSIAESRDIFHGDGINITLLNRTLSPKSITKIEIVKDNKYILTVKKYEIPFILEPMKVYLIIGDKYTYIKSPTVYNVYFIITIDEKEQFIKHRGKMIKYKAIKRLQKLERIAYEIRYFGEETLSKNVKYALHYKNGNTYNTTLVLENGVIDKSPFYFTAFPKEAMRDTDSLIAFIKNNFPTMDFKIQELSG